ncbi:MAG: beta-lactamase family protein [Kordiimonadaceae bacterium]|nr:beta-lactamase family protein [Kordiimonadaceae bacterium]
MKAICILFVGLLGLSQPITAGGETHSALSEKIEQTITGHVNDLLSSPEVTGITYAASKDGKIIFSSGFGLTDINTNELVTSATKMRTGSVSKVYTAALIGKLLAAGKLDLDQVIQTYIPNFPEKNWPFTVRQLSAHMAGIRNYKGNEFSSTKHYSTVSEGLAMFQNDPLEFEPGTKVSYTSHGWNVIARALEGAGEKPFLEQMQQQIFTPLAMHNTGPEDVTKTIDNLASFHEVKEGVTQIAPFVDNSYKWAGGGFIGTASDMAAFGNAHLNAGFHDSKTLTLLSTEQTIKDGTPAEFAIGWMTASNMRTRLGMYKQLHHADSFSDGLIWHAGGSMGAVALLLVEPETQTTVAMMANNSSSFPALAMLGLETLKLAKDHVASTAHKK